MNPPVRHNAPRPPVRHNAPRSPDYQCPVYHQTGGRRPRRRPRGQDPSRRSREQTRAGTGTHQQHPSISSNNTFHPANNGFYIPNPQHTYPYRHHNPPPHRNHNRMSSQQQPAHPITAVWKSERCQEEDEYQRSLKKVRYMAPEFVKDGLFPQNTQEWRHFKLGRVQDQLKDKEKDTEEISRRIQAADNIPSQGRNIKSAFGAGGKELKIAGGSVLAMPTIWSDQHTSNGSAGNWPTQAELLMHGDNRDATHRPYRSLPPPRKSAEASNQSYQEQSIIVPQLMDEAEPEFSQGPSYVDYTQENTHVYDENPVFNGYGHRLLGESLVQAIGPKRYRILAEEKGRRRNKVKIEPFHQQHVPTMSQQVPTILLNAASPTFIPAMNVQDFQEGPTSGQANIDSFLGVGPIRSHHGDGSVALAAGGYGGGYGGGVIPGPYGYARQMHDGSLGYPQQDGSWSFVPGPAAGGI